MIKKAIIITLSVLLVSAIGYAGDKDEEEVSASEEREAVAVARTITMAPPEGVEAKQPPVTFSHLEHAMDHGCGACHHQWEPEKQDVPHACSTCHTNFEQMQGEMSFFKAFHDRQAEASCLGCHGATIKEEGSPAGPIKCNECHIRKE